MAITWADNVNTRILDQTQINIGDGGFVEDKGSNGEFKERRLTSLAVPDTFSVQMDFDWLVKDQYGLSEFDRFVTWYKYVHKRGTKPFWFDSITKFNVNGSINPVNPITGQTEKCQYKITSGLKPVKSGFSYRVTMTWEEVYSGPGILIEPPTLAPDHMLVENGHITLFFNHKPVPDPDHPAISDFKLSYCLVGETEYTDLEITTLTPDGNIENIYFDELPKGNYFIKLSYLDMPLIEPLGVK